MRREAPTGILTLLGIGAGILGSAGIAVLCFILAIVWGVVATISGLRSRSRRASTSDHLSGGRGDQPEYG